MRPNFTKKTVETLAKRAAMMCSNPDCRTLTSGPTKVPDKSLNIGEAAHIYGAKQGSARYRDDMTNSSRSEITNGIWLCKNCHKLIDNDPNRWPAELVYIWRNLHEEHVISELGSPGEKVQAATINQVLERYQAESPLAQQIIRDKIDGWEYRLTAEILTDYFKKPFRQWYDLSNGLYANQRVHLEEEEALRWFQKRLSEASDLIPTFSNIFPEFQKAWGAPGQPGDPDEIIHLCQLIERAVKEMITWEEGVHFVSVPDAYAGLFLLLSGVVGVQLDRLKKIPTELNKLVDWAEDNPDGSRTETISIEFDVPPGWSDAVDKELERISHDSTWT